MSWLQTSKQHKSYCPKLRQQPEEEKKKQNNKKLKRKKKKKEKEEEKRTEKQRPDLSPDAGKKCELEGEGLITSRGSRETAAAVGAAAYLPGLSQIV